MTLPGQSPAMSPLRYSKRAFVYIRGAWYLGLLRVVAFPRAITVTTIAAQSHVLVDHRDRS